MSEPRIRPEAQYRVYYYVNEEPQDIYINGYSAQDAVDRIRKIDPDAKIVDVAKIVKGWK